MSYQGKIQSSYFTNAAIPTATYTEVLSAANNGNGVRRISVSNGTDQNIILAIGPSGSEVDICHFGKSAAMYSEDILIDEGVRVAIKSKLALSTSGELILNLWG